MQVVLNATLCTMAMLAALRLQTHLQQQAADCLAFWLFKCSQQAYCLVNPFLTPLEHVISAHSQSSSGASTSVHNPLFTFFLATPSYFPVLL